ncbi:hypothetical protein FRACYDRAFT_251213 [Fragilariopsis cylindrus CCMP1102]|uniref:Uncharacterized protein n=1 Tax=Fragilariopsis cylindrus CCMP1102 TaxID=635003 RepID=A0A1E7EN77_9STRA|nr:hypothetical protein FRACYDRAFT_251213 [Fragilariopsis cylindrus CCMP1102]|eukprot:OEU07409.1 hypothetical protein FRACYDRAFT_251213 [Fragilariopsis cylindrus CCMP1102]
MSDIFMINDDYHHHICRQPVQTGSLEYLQISLLTHYLYLFGSGFAFTNVLRSSENTRLIIIGTDTTTTVDNSSSDNNGEHNSSIISTTGELVLSVKDIDRVLLREYATTTMVGRSVHEYEYDVVYADDNSNKDEILERKLNPTSKEKGNDKGSKTIASINGLSASPKNSLPKKTLIKDLKRFTEEILSIDGVIQSSNPFKEFCTVDAIELIAGEISSDSYTTDFGYRVILEPSPEVDTAIVEVLAAPLKGSSKKKLKNDLTRAAKVILDINGLIKPSNVYKDSIVKIIIEEKIDCINIYTDGQIPKKVKTCHKCRMSISGSNADDAIRLVTRKIPTIDLSFGLVLKPSVVPFTASKEFYVHSKTVL